jgi:hypothetical protein
MTYKKIKKMNVINNRCFFVTREMDLKKGVDVIDGQLVFDTVIRTKKLAPKFVKIKINRQECQSLD